METAFASSSDATLLRAEGLACRRGEKLLFTGLSLAVGAKEALQVAGPNGSGKTSLLRLLAGLSRPFAGTVARGGRIAMQDARHALDAHWPLERALAFWARCDGAGQGAMEAAAARTGLADLMDVPVRYLSTGQRKRATLARILAQNAPLWLLDEPLSGLDEDAIAMVESLVSEHCTMGGACVIASHQPLRIAGLSRLALADFAP